MEGPVGLRLHHGRPFFQPKGKLEKASVGKAFWNVIIRLWQQLERDSHCERVRAEDPKVRIRPLPSSCQQQRLSHLLQCLAWEWRTFLLKIKPETSERHPPPLTTSSCHQVPRTEPPALLANAPTSLSLHYHFSNKSHRHVSLGLSKWLLRRSPGIESCLPPTHSPRCRQGGS